MGAALGVATGGGYSVGAALFDAGTGLGCAGVLSKAGRLGRLIAANKRAGDALEALLGISARGKKAIPPPSGTAARRFPDELTETVLREVKSGGNIRLTSQLQDFMDFAQETGRQFVLEVKETARIDQRLLDLEEAGRIIINRHR